MVKRPLASCMLGCFPDSYTIGSLDSVVGPLRLLWLMEVFVSLVASHTMFGQTMFEHWDFAGSRRYLHVCL